MTLGILAVVIPILPAAPVVVIAIWITLTVVANTLLLSTSLLLSSIILHTVNRPRNHPSIILLPTMTTSICIPIRRPRPDILCINR